MVILKNNSFFIKDSLQLPALHDNTIICYPDRIHDVVEGFVTNEVMQIHAEAHHDIMNYFNIQETSQTNLIHIICERFEIELANKKLELENDASDDLCNK